VQWKALVADSSEAVKTLGCNDDRGVRIIAKGGGKVIADLYLCGELNRARSASESRIWEVAELDRWRFAKPAARDWRNLTVLEVPTAEIAEISMKQAAGTGSGELVRDGCTRDQQHENCCRGEKPETRHWFRSGIFTSLISRVVTSTGRPVEVIGRIFLCVIGYEVNVSCGTAATRYRPGVTAMENSPRVLPWTACNMLDQCCRNAGSAAATSIHGARTGWPDPSLTVPRIRAGCCVKTTSSRPFS